MRQRAQRHTITISDKLTHNEADQRYYNSNAGRFYTPDRAGFRAANLANPTSWNMYLYTGDDPVNRNDPTGLTDVVIAGITDSQSSNSISDFAGQIGAIEVFPFSGGSIPGGVGSVLGATLTSGAAAEAVE
jgi:RHS repeat-associated protein